MKNDDFAGGVWFALTAAVGGSILVTVLSDLATPHELLRILSGGLTLAYLVYLLRTSRRRIGRLVALGGWAGIALAGWILLDHAAAFVLLNLGAIWLVRALFHQSGALASMLDLALNISAAMAAFWAYRHSASPFLAVWTFFLVQALFVAIPRPDAGRRRHARDRFSEARHDAENALRRLAGTR